MTKGDGRTLLPCAVSYKACKQISLRVISILCPITTKARSGLDIYLGMQLLEVSTPQKRGKEVAVEAQTRRNDMVIADNELEAKAATDKDQLQQLEYELGLIERKEQAFKLRAAKVAEVEEDKVATLMAQIEQRLRDEELLMAKEDDARKLRMAEIQEMKLNLDKMIKVEQVRKSKEGMAQEIFEEDAERMKFELGGKIEKLTSESRKRKITSDNESASRSKK